MNESNVKCVHLDQVVPYGLGDLAAEESRAFERHLETCPDCRREWERFPESVEPLLAAAPRAEPPAHLLDDLMARVRGKRPAEGLSVQPWRRWSSNAPASGLLFVGAAESAWEPTSIPGIESRRLFADPASDRTTMLVRMAPGTAYPGHRHAGFEECYVLEGDLTVGERVMRTGDYQYAPPGTVHPVQSTEGGCVLLLSSSLSDEMVG